MLRSLQFAAFVLALFISSHAQATALTDCTDACFSGYSCSISQPNGLSTHDCQSGRDSCVAQCRKNVNQGMGIPPGPGAYGAFAYDKESGAWGIADASKDKMSADQSALGYCQKYGKNCKLIESFSKQCVAVATGTNHRLGWGVHDDVRQAELNAIRKCGVKKGDSDRCYLQIYNCYSP